MRRRVVLIGPHGAGKTTLARALVADPASAYKYELEQLVTSRPRRTGEDDLEYKFVSHEQFDNEKQHYQYVQLNRGVNGNYALPVDRPIAENSVRIYVVIPETARYLKKTYPGETIIIGILPPSADILRRRLTQRDPNVAQEEVDVRLRYLDYDLEQAQQLGDVVFYNQGTIAEAAAALRTTIEQRVQE